jgi:hypothetical protein
MTRFWFIAAVAATAGSAGAQEIGVGVGAHWRVDDGDAALAVDLDVASDDLLSWGPVSLAAGAGVEADTDAALWGGAGPIVRVRLSERWRLDGSVMAGVYTRGDGVDLGGALQFRSTIGFSYAVAPAWRVGAAVSHKSNAGIYDENPGIERVVARVAYSF